MSEITICGQPLVIKEYKGQRVVTFKDIDRVHGRPAKTACNRFNANRKRFVENTDFIKITAHEFRYLFGDLDKRHRGDMYLITESGYLMLVKSFTDDLAWQVQRELVNGYFKSREQQAPALTEDLNAVREDIREIRRRLDEITTQKQELPLPVFNDRSGNDVLKKRKSFINCMIADLIATYGCTANQALSKCYRYMLKSWGVDVQSIHSYVCEETNDWSLSTFEAVCRDPYASRVLLLAAAMFLDGDNDT